MQIFIPVDRARVWLKKDYRADGARMVVGRAQITVCCHPPGRPEQAYTWNGAGSMSQLSLVSCPENGPLPELLLEGGGLPADWSTTWSETRDIEPMWSPGGPESPFQISYAYPWLVCPDCLVMHRASCWVVSDEGAYLCPACKVFRDVELQYEQLSTEVLKELVLANIARRRQEQEFELENIRSQLARL